MAILAIFRRPHLVGGRYKRPRLSRLTVIWINSLMLLLIFNFFCIFVAYCTEIPATSSPISIVPDWVLLSGCGPCRYCLALQGYEEPFFCITEVSEIPCYIRAQFYPDWTDGCTDTVAQEDVVPSVDKDVVLTVVENPVPECEPKNGTCRCQEHVYFLVWAILCFVVFIFILVVFLYCRK